MSMTDVQKQWLAQPGALRAALFELTFLGNNGGAAGEMQAYVGNMPYVLGGSALNGVPAHTTFRSCVLQIPEYVESMGEQLAGRTTQSYGDIILANNRTAAYPEGIRHSWLAMNWDGRRVRWWLGDPSWDFDDFLLVLDGVLVDVYDAGRQKIGFKLSDKGALLDRPVMTTLLGGDGPQAGDLMPLALGSSVVTGASLHNIAPKLFDTDHIYAVSAVDSGGLVEALWQDSSVFPMYKSPVQAVREDGADLSTTLYLESSSAATDLLHITAHGLVDGSRVQFPLLVVIGTAPAPLVSSPVQPDPGDATDYWVIADGLTADDFKVSATMGGAAVNLTGAQSLTPRVSVFNWTLLPNNSGIACIQLSGNPAGMITADVFGLGTGGGANPDQMITAGDIINQVLTSSLTNTPFTSADIDATSLAAFIALCPQSVARWLTETINFTELIDQLVLSVGGFWHLSGAGLLQFGRFDLPVAGTPVHSFVAGDMAQRSFGLRKRILPRAQVKVSSVVNWTQQPTVAGSVSGYYRAFYAAGPRVFYTGEATVTTWDTDPANHKNAVIPKAFSTYLVSAQQAEADRLATMFQYPTGIYGFQTHQIAFGISVGDLIYVEREDFTGYGIVTTVRRRVKGRSEIEFFAQIPDVYPESHTLLYSADMVISLVAEIGTGSPTFTRATAATFNDFEAVLKTAISGESRFTVARRVQNLHTTSSELLTTGWLSNGAPTYSSDPDVPVGTGIVQSTKMVTGANYQGPYQNVTVIGRVYTKRVWLKGAVGGELAFITDSGGTGGPVTITTSWRLYSKTWTAVSASSGVLSNTGSPRTIYMAGIQTEDVTGQTNQNPSEYVPVGVASTPWYGAGIDGCKYFPYQNGNTVASNIVTEAQGAAIPEATLLGYLAEGARTNLFIQSNDFTNVAWVKTTMTTAKTSTGTDGVTNSATRLTASGALATVLQLLVAAASSRTWSVWARRVTGTGTIKLFQGATKTADLASQLNSTTYTQISQNASVDITLLGAGIEIGTDTDAIDVWCGQLEAGAFASAPIQTTTVAVTRNAEIDSYPTASNIIAAQGTISMGITPQHAPSGTVFFWGTYVDASNYTALLHDATNLIFRKRIAGTNYDATIAWAFVSGTTGYVHAQWGTSGLAIKLNDVMGTPHANTDAAQIGSTMQWGADGNSLQQPFATIEYARIYDDERIGEL